MRTNEKNGVLYIVVPCFNEQEILIETAKRLKEKIELYLKNNKICEKSKILFVDDGSKDNTWQIIENLHNNDDRYSGIKLSHNKGHQFALLAGLETANKYADMTISIDADLQDDVDAIDKMIDLYYEGNDVVYGVRSSRKKDSFFKRFTAESFYKIMTAAGTETVFNHADFRLMSKRAVNALFEYTERNVYLRGIVPQLGFQSDKVEYERKKRTAGESKYPLKKMIALAIEGITSFSIKPLSFILTCALIFIFLGIMGFAVSLILFYTCDIEILWSFVSALIFSTGIVLLAIGIIGVYVGKIYLETKCRPRYIIEKELV